MLEGRCGVRLGSTVVDVEPGDLMYSPRDVWHTFWNATDAPARLLEIIPPAGVEHLFLEVAGSLRAPEDLQRARALRALGLRVDVDATTAPITGEHGLVEHPT